MASRSAIHAAPAPHTSNAVRTRQTGSLLGPLVNLVQALLLDRRYYWHFVFLLVAFEAVFGYLIIRAIPYTKIDWDAYMRFAEQFLAGERDYTRFLGDTGPCVYPAFFLYVFTALHELLPAGGRERPAQFLYLGLYLVNLLLVSTIYYLAGRPARAGSFVQAQANHVPQALLIPLALSKREHSIYMLRLFNDPWAMMFLYAAVIAFMLGGEGKRRRLHWRIGSALFSLALGIKMNILLFLPGLLVLLFQLRGLVGTLESLAILVLVQVALPAPFFLSFPGSGAGKAGDTDLTRAYLSRAFEFSRQFLYEWTVNWRFISEKTFLSASWARGLLLVHVGLLVAFGLFRWSPFPGGTLGVLRRGLAPFNWTRPPVHSDQIPSSHIPLVLFSANLIGMACARSLHYQFHNWYFLQLPFLLWSGAAWGLLPFGAFLWAIIELAWSTAPSTPTSSVLLLLGHAGMIAGLWFCGPRARRPQQPIKTE